MKRFLNDYGFAILAAIVVIVLVAFSSSVSSAIQKQTVNTIQSLGKVANNDLNKIDDSVSLIDLTSINKSGVVGDFSRKGNLVTINGTQYRVLEVNGTQVKVMSMVNVGSSVFNSSSVTTSFGETNGQKYAGSNLDNAMTSYYNSLPSAIQDAIIEQNINQTMYSFTWSIPAGSTATSVASNNMGYIIEKKGEINAGSRKVYALDVDDVLGYLGSNFTWKQLNKMVFDTESSVNLGVWLRSADSCDNDGVFYVYGGPGYLRKTYRGYNYETRPTFVLDLYLLS